MGCGSDQPTGPGDGEPESVRGVIFFEGEAPFAIVPDSVRAGEEFEVTVRTWGSNTGWRLDRTEVDRQGSRAVIRPYNFVGTSGGFAIIEIDHSATLRFESSGLKTVIFEGTDFSGALVAFSRLIRVVDG